MEKANNKSPIKYITHNYLAKLILKKYPNIHNIKIYFSLNMGIHNHVHGYANFYPSMFILDNKVMKTADILRRLGFNKLMLEFNEYLFDVIVKIDDYMNNWRLGKNYRLICIDIDTTQIINKKGFQFYKSSLKGVDEEEINKYSIIEYCQDSKPEYERIKCQIIEEYENE